MDTPTGTTRGPVTPLRPHTPAPRHDDVVLPAAVPSADDVRPDEISFIELLNALLRRRWLVLKAMFWTATAVCSIRLAWPANYTVMIEFTPQASTSSSTLSSLSGLAAQVGLTMPSLSSGPTPDLYVTLLTSPDFLRPLVLSRYRFTDDDGVHWDADYLDLYDWDKGSAGKTVDYAITYLMKRMDASADDNTGIVTVDVTTKWPQLSRLMAQEVLDMMDGFNVSARQQQARALEEFSDQRLGQSNRELQAAEDSLARFQIVNRDISNSPILSLESARLQRDISLKQAVYINLVQTYEQARIDAVRNTPSLVVALPALEPLRADKKHMLIWGLASLFVGGMLGLCLAFAGFVAEQSRRSDPHNVEELGRVLAAAKGEVRQLHRRLIGWFKFHRL